MKIIALFIVISLYTIFLLQAVAPVSAQIGTIGKDTVEIKLDQPQGYGIPAFGSSGEGLVSTITKNVIFLFFAVGGLGTIVYFLWGAVDWILAGGDKEKISAARKKMTNALIGLTLLALSFVIIRTVGQIVGFNPLGSLQIRGLGNTQEFVPNK